MFSWEWVTAPFCVMIRPVTLTPLRGADGTNLLIFDPRWALNGTVRALVTIVMAMAAAGAAAQYPGGGGGAGGGGGRPGGAGSGGRSALPELRMAPERAPVAVADQVQIQLGELEDDLRLSSAQRPLWKVFADRVQKLAGDVARDRDKLRFPKGTAAEQFDFVSDKARDRLTAIEDISDAGKQLYASLSPTQKEIADRRMVRLAIPLVTNVQSPPATGRASGTDGDGTAGRARPHPP